MPQTIPAQSSIPAELLDTAWLSQAIDAAVDKNVEAYRRDLCRVHAKAVEGAPMPLLCALDERFAAGYQTGLIEAAKMLRKMGEKK